MLDPVSAVVGGFFQGAVARVGWLAFSAIATALVLAGWLAWSHFFGGPSAFELSQAAHKARAEAVSAINGANTAVLQDARDRAADAEEAAGTAREASKLHAEREAELQQIVRELAKPTAATVCFSPETVEAMRKW